MKRNVFPTFNAQTSTSSAGAITSNHRRQYSRAAVVKTQGEDGGGGGGVDESVHNNRVTSPPPISGQNFVDERRNAASTSADRGRLLDHPSSYGGDQHQHNRYVENVNYCRHNSVTSETIDRYCSIVAGPSTIATSVVVGSMAVGGLSPDGYPIHSRNGQTDAAEPLSVDTNVGGYAVNTNPADDYQFPNRSTVGGGGCAFTTLNHSNHSASSGNNKDWLSKQQQQFAFFPNATEKVMANTRRIIVLSIYSSSVVLSMILFFLAGVYCQVTGCSITWAESNRQYAQLFPIASSCLIAFLSTCWLISNFRRVETTCMRDYNFLEMPTAVFSALLAGVCAVIEIHYNFDYSYLYWSEKWALAAADSVILVFLHAGLAFALT